MHKSAMVLESVAIAVLLFCSSAAHAGTIEFFGSRDTVDGAAAIPNPARCGTPAPPNLYLDLPAGSGTSNLGAFSHKDSHCKLPPINGVASFFETFTIAGGTGQFLNSSGSFSGLGTVTFKPTGLADSHFDFRGSITTVPEPATLALLALGFAAVGFSRRRL